MILSAILYFGLLFSLFLSLFHLKNNYSENITSYLNNSSISKYKLAINLALLFIIFISTFRYDVGTDFLGYLEWYNNYDYFISKGYSIFNEYGFHLIVVTGIFLSFSSIWLFFVFSTLSWSLLLKTFTPKLSLFFLFFLLLDERLFWSFSGIRQWLAISFFIVSIVKYTEKKYLYFFLYISCGSLFHTSILLMIPVVLFLSWLPKIVLNKKIVLLLFFLTLFFGSSEGLNQVMQSSFLKLTAIIPEFKYYARHIDLGRLSNSIESQDLPGIGFWLKRILDLLLIIEIFKYQKKIPRIWINLFLLGVLYFNLFYSVEILLRMSLYMLIFRSLLWARVFQLNHKLNHKLSLVLIIYLTLFTYAFINHSNNCCPYNFV